MTAADLTPAELDILRRLLAGLTQDQVADARDSARATVTRQIHLLKLKTGVRTLLQLGAWAERHGVREVGAQP